MERVLRGSASAVLTAAASTSEEQLLLAGSADVTVTRDDGTEVASGTATVEGADLSFVLPASALEELAILTAEWQVVLSGGGTVTVVTEAQVVEHRLISLADLWALDDKLADTTRFPLARVLALRNWFEAVVDAAVGSSLLERYWVRPVRVPARTSLLSVPDLYPRRLVRLEGASGPLPVEGAEAELGGTLVLPSEVGPGSYEAGLVAGIFPAPPQDLREAGTSAVRSRLLEGRSPIAARQTAVRTSDGDLISMSLASKDRPTGYPDVDAVILRYAQTYRVPAVG